MIQASDYTGKVDIIIHSHKIKINGRPFTSQIELLKTVLDECTDISSNYILKDTDEPEVKSILKDGEPSTIMLYIKNIIGDPGLYNDSIAKLVFGPDLIHKDIFSKIQYYMLTNNYKRCIYILHSIDLQQYYFQCVLPFDIVYIKWKNKQ